MWTQRFKITSYKYYIVPRKNTSPYLDSEYMLDKDGNIIYDPVAVPVGHWIGPGKKTVDSYKESHKGKPKEYFKKNVLKEFRV